MALAVALAGCSGGADGAGDAGSATERADARPPGAGWRGVVLEEPLARPDFTLTDTGGRPYDFRERTSGRLTLLFFGYTHCPDFCPVQMANLAAVYDDLPPGARRRTEVVFVTVDPERDTRRRLREWLARFDESFVGLRGPPERVRAVQERLDLPPAVRQGRSGGEAYTMGHASQVIVFTPDDRAHLVYPFGTRQRDWAHDLPRLASGGWTGS